MAISYPAGLDNFTNPTGADTLATTPHSTHHANLNDAVEALETRVGITGSVDATSLTKRIAVLEAAGSPPAWAPADSNLLAWSADPMYGIGSVSAMNAGTLYLTKIKIPTAGTVTNISVRRTASTALTGVYLALFNSAGALLSQSASAHVAFGSSGLKTVALSVAQAVTPGFFFVGAWYTGTSLTLGTVPGVIGDDMNFGLASPNFRMSISTTGLTTTAPNPFGAQTSSTLSPWAALS